MTKADPGIGLTTTKDDIGTVTPPSDGQAIASVSKSKDVWSLDRRGRPDKSPQGSRSSWPRVREMDTQLRANEQECLLCQKNCGTSSGKPNLASTSGWATSPTSRAR